MARVAVIKFPGTNCDEDVVKAFREIGRGISAEVVWHKDFRHSDRWDAIVIPGGFSYGDWLRAGAIAARSRAATELIEAAAKGTPILGICNGFQILVEMGLLKGAFLPNKSGMFVCRWVRLYIENPKGPWLSLVEDKAELHMPVAHGEGRYYVEEKEYEELRNNPLLRYAPEHNPNGSFYNIAGVGSKDGSILGLMPHPERAVSPQLAPRGFSTGGRVIFESIAHSLTSGW